MSQILNDRDVLLQTSAQRSTPPTDRAILLGASSNVFKVALGGAAAPGSITLAAVLLGMTGVVTFSTAPATRLTVSNNLAVLDFGDTGADPVTITASFAKDGVTYEARQTIVRVADGQPGSNGLAGTSTGLAYAYKRAAAAPADNPGAVTFKFGEGRITAPATDALANGWSKSIPAGTDPLYVTVASASNSALTDDIAAGEWAAPVLYVQNGLSSATVMIYQRAASAVAPALPTADTTYTFATSVLAGLNNGWSATVPAASGGAYLYVSSATAVSAGASDTIAPGEWAAVRQMAKDGANGTNGLNGSDGSNGQRGTVDVVASGYTSWSDASATNAIITAGYGYPQNRDRVTLTGTNFSETRFYNNGSWLTIAAWINGNMVVDGTFSAAKITFGTMTGVGMYVAGGNFQINASTGSVQAYAFNGTNSTFGNAPNPGLPSVSITGASAGVTPTVKIVSAGSNASAHALQAQNSNYGTSGIVGMSGFYDFYADGSGTNYGPFTGAHDALVPNDAAPDLGDLMVDVACVASRGYSNTLFTMERTSVPYQRGVRGPVAAIAGPLRDHAPAAMIDGRSYSFDEDGKLLHVHELMTDSYYTLADSHTLVAVNAVGEGSIKVCGESGPIGPDDLLVASSTPGVAMRQNVGQLAGGAADDVVRCYTVAKARVAPGQAVEFAHADSILVVPCIYLGG